MIEDSTPNYMAFLSYRHADNTEEDRQWATWLHQQLEVYDIPADLIGTTNLRGEVIPERIYPVFRDEVSLPADADLASAIATALDRSQTLIVLCSPRAVMSRYVQEEILHFKRTGKADRIMAGILLGEPNASIDDSKIEDPEDVRTLECFPKPLQHHLGSDKELDLESYAEPIAANFRLPDGSKGLTSANVFGRQLLAAGESKESIDAKVSIYEEQLNNAKLKLIAGILGVPLEKLTQRDRLYQLKKLKKAEKEAQDAAKRARSVAVAFAILTTISASAGYFAYSQWQLAQQQQKLTEQQRERAETNLKLAQQAVDSLVMDLTEGFRNVKGVPTIVLNRILDRVETLQTGLEVGNEANDELLAGKISFLLSRGDTLVTQGQFTAALEQFYAAHKIAEKTSELDPENRQWKRTLSIILNKVGRALLERGGWLSARNAFEKSLAVRRELAALDPLNAQFKRDLSISLVNFGTALGALGNDSGSLKYFEEGLEIARELSDLDPHNSELKRDLSITYERVGGVLVAQGDRLAALNVFKDGLAVRQELSALDPQNSQWKRDVSLSYLRIGDVLTAQDDRSGALKVFESSLTISRELSALDPQNSEWRRDVTFGLIKVGDVLVTQGDRSGAQKAFEDSLAIRQELSTLDPQNSAWKLDVSVNLEKVGDVLAAQGDRSGAQKAFEDGLVITRELSAQYPQNRNLQRDIVAFYGKLAEISESGDQWEQAVYNWMQVIEQLQMVQSLGVLTVSEVGFLSMAERRLVAARKKLEVAK